jgi:ankyrin repeat protein
MQCRCKCCVEGWMVLDSWCSITGDFGLLKLLIDSGADVNVRSCSVTPAMQACDGDYMSCLQLLVDNKADLNVPHDKITEYHALYIAVKVGGATSLLSFAVT